MTLFDVINSALSVVVLIRAIHIVNHMNGKTQHLVRTAVVLLAVAALGFALAPLFVQVPQWLTTLLVLAVAIYISTDRRSPPLKERHI